jgi:hypothetical protein
LPAASASRIACTASWVLPEPAVPVTRNRNGVNSSWRAHAASPPDSRVTSVPAWPTSAGIGRERELVREEVMQLRGVGNGASSSGRIC